MLPKVAERGLFNISKFQCGGTKKEDVYKKFDAEAKYHKKCYTQYDQDHFNRLPPPTEKASEPDESGPTSSKRCKRDSIPLGEMVCFICKKPDKNLCAAGVMHGSKTAVDKQHVEDMTEKIKTMAIALDNKTVLAKLFSGDIVSNELNYHKSCYKDFVCKYNQKTLEESNREASLQNEIDEFWKAVCFNKVIKHMRETYVTGIDFEASALLKLYERLLKENNVTYSPHLTRFTEDILYQN